MHLNCFSIDLFSLSTPLSVDRNFVRLLPFSYIAVILCGTCLRYLFVPWGWC